MEMRVTPRLMVVIVVLFSLAVACSLPTKVQETQLPADNPQTRAVETLNSLMTEVASLPSTSTPGNGLATNTPQSIDLIPTSTPQPTNTAITLPTPTGTQVCDQAAFITDVTIPDGSTFPAGSTFVKTWRIKNTGTCTWTPDYALVFDGGDSMSSPAAQNIGVSVIAGQTVDVSVTLKAPGQPGSYRGYWKLRNASGVIFGIGGNAGQIFIDIKVVLITPASGNYDFSANACAAEWTGNDKTLPCRGTDGNADGFVLYKSQPILETGYVDDQHALLTNPPRVNDGVIRGKYPVYTVSSGDHFKSIIGCEHNAKNCNVRFQLDYQVDGGTIQTLASWHEIYDDKFTSVDVDLSSLAGSNVRFILTVFANGASDMDRAQWLLPRID